MTIPENILALIAQGEGLDVEFKKSTTSIPSDVYSTVCSFANRNGGHLFLGVLDDGHIIGIEEENTVSLMKNFVTSVNTQQNQPASLPDAYSYEYEGKLFYISTFHAQKVYADAMEEYLIEVMTRI
jgi:ATP-dependent DNA helicase RecG